MKLRVSLKTYTELWILWIKLHFKAVSGLLFGVLAKTQFVQNAKTQFENAKTQFEN